MSKESIYRSFVETCLRNLHYSYYTVSSDRVIFYFDFITDSYLGIRKLADVYGGYDLRIFHNLSGTETKKENPTLLECSQCIRMFKDKYKLEIKDLLDEDSL